MQIIYSTKELSKKFTNYKSIKKEYGKKNALKIYKTINFLKASPNIGEIANISSYRIIKSKKVFNEYYLLKPLCESGIAFVFTSFSKEGEILHKGKNIFDESIDQSKIYIKGVLKENEI
ncbi:MAG: hypothetical protein WCR97_05125 [Bacilli bacterium]